MYLHVYLDFYTLVKYILCILCLIEISNKLLYIFLEISFPPVTGEIQKQKRSHVRYMYSLYINLYLCNTEACR